MKKASDPYISENIFSLLKEKGMSQKDFSQKTGIPQSTISDWKGKKINPAADKILIISKVLDADPAEILGEKADKRNPKDDSVTISKNSEEYVLLESLSKLDESQKKRVMGYIEALSENQIRKIE